MGRFALKFNNFGLAVIILLKINISLNKKFTTYLLIIAKINKFFAVPLQNGGKSGTTNETWS